MKLHPRVGVTFEIAMTLSEPEARAVAAICCYGADVFLSAFYEKMGKAHLEPHAEGFRSLCHSVDERLAPLLRQVDDAYTHVNGLRDNWATAAAKRAQSDILYSASRTLRGSQ